MLRCKKEAGNLKIGVLALQGSVREHILALKKCNVEAIPIKLPSDLENINGLIIPGGESTTMGKLMREYKLDKAIKKRHKEGMPIYGTCAGAILLAKNIVDSKQPKLGLMDISIKRNDYGRQVDSFETDIDVFDKPFKGVFIRAPIVDNCYDGCKIMAKLGDRPILLRQKNLLISTFHPELTDDLRLHKYFLDMVEESRNSIFSGFQEQNN
ncbi:MAG: pyridoxal 5'-phosphate synthase glutaminase subunit PdxT [Nanoarchaeota archaeon]|nr:pyridoxal 5'-phosphate synthase glutaminase subunit PdxT [Nanoarchaeota archaeon]